MNITAVIGLALIAAALGVLLRQYRPEYGMILSVIAGAGIFFMIIAAVSPALDAIKNAGERANINSEYITILLKALGICYITQLACDACKDAGETAMAGKVELAGRAAIIVLALPLFNSVIDLITGFLK